MMNQQPKLTKYSSFTGFFKFNDSVVGDIFNVAGHRNAGEALEKFYCKPIDNLSTMDWQHGTANYQQVLDVGIVGIIDKIEKSILRQTEKDKADFLKCLKRIGQTVITWMEKCAKLSAE